MASLSEMSLMCRLCLLEDQKQVNIPIFEDRSDKLLVKISGLLPIKISEEDRLPKRICNGCSNKLDLFYDFRNAALDSEQTLLSWLKDDNLIINALAETAVKEKVEIKEDTSYSDLAQFSFFDEEAEEPPAKRPRRFAAIESPISIASDSDNVHDQDEFDTIENLKYESDNDEDIAKSENESYNDLPVPENSAYDQPGPSDLGRSGAETPCEIPTDDELSSTLPPEKSRRQYENAYQLFKKWCKTNKASEISENLLLAYFAEKSRKVKPSTLWAIYFMLKPILSVRESVDFKKFTKLVPYLKKMSAGKHLMKSKAFTQEEVDQFITEADDDTYLMNKLVLILGILGACRREELTRMTVDDIEDNDSILIVKIPDTKTDTQRIFIVSNLDYIDIYRKYVALRPTYTSNRRLFLKYKNMRCFNKAIGINNIAKMPSSIAKYLKLPNSDAYTGRCFRVTSFSLLANAGGDIVSLKQHGGWKSSTVDERYISDCEISE